MMSRSAGQNAILSHRVLSDVLKDAAGRCGDASVVHVSPTDGSEDRQTYSELYQEARLLSSLMKARGWRAQDKLVFVLDDSRSFVTCFWACILIGVVPVPLSPLITRDRDSMEAEKIRGVLDLLNAPILIDSRLAGYADLYEEFSAGRGCTTLYADELTRDATILAHDDIVDSPSSVVIQPDDLAVLQFSSGSSGVPKGVELSHQNIIANIDAQIRFSRANEQDLVCTWLPYFHDFGLFWGHLFSVFVGISQVHISPDHFAKRPLIWLEKMSAHRATMTNTTPTALKHLNDFLTLKQRKGPITGIDLSALRSLFIGAEMIDPGECRRAMSFLMAMGCPESLIQGGYGLTETTMVATATEPGPMLRTRVIDRLRLANSGVVQEVDPTHPHAVEYASVGKAMDYCEIRVVDESGAPLRANCAGVVHIRGLNVSRGYFNNPEANQKAFTEGGWFDSGDIGFMDEEGNLTITGRQKEMIIVGGKNYYPWDIEQIALRCPHTNKGIRHLTICASWSPALHREEVMLFFVPSKVSDEVLTRVLHEINASIAQVAGFSVDSFIPLSMREVPRTSSGKVMRRVLVHHVETGTLSRMEIRPAAEAPPKAAVVRTPEAIETLLREVWSESLGIDPVSIQPNCTVFELGCNSLMAYHIQARLEERLGHGLNTNFNYRHPVFAEQVTAILAVDPSVHSPANDLESIIRTVLHDVTEFPEQDICVIKRLTDYATDLQTVLILMSEIKRVFDLDQDEERLIKGTSIREIAVEIGAILKKRTMGENNGTYPLMNFQETLYFHQKGFVRNEPSGLSCFILLELLLKAPRNHSIDPVMLGHAFDRLIERHDVLRSVISEDDERPMLKVLSRVNSFKVRYVDLSVYSLGEAEAILNERSRDLNDHRFAIEQWPMFMAELYLRPDGQYTLMFHIDHLLIDGYSFMHLMQEVLETYESLAFGTRLTVSQHDLSFGDYARIEEARQRTRQYQRALERQMSLFDNLPTKPELPGRVNPASVTEVQFDTYYHMLDKALVTKLASAAASQAVTLNSLLLAAWFKLVNLWSGQNDLIINMPVFNREQYFPGARLVMGTFIDIFPVRVQTHASEPVIEIARKVERFTRELLAVPVSSIELSRKIADRDGGASGSMSALIFSNSIGVYGGDMNRLKHLVVDRPHFRTGAPGTVIDLVMYDYQDDYYVNWNYVREVFDASFIETLAQQYLSICDSVQAPDQGGTPGFDVCSVIPAPFLSALGDNHRNVAEFPAKTMADMVIEQALDTPDNTAIHFEDQKLSYRELIERAAQVAHLVISRLGPGQQSAEASDVSPFIAILFERGVDMIVSQLGVLMAGYAYVPIDPAYPRDRLAYVLNDCRATVLLTSLHLLSSVPSQCMLDQLIVVDSETSLRVGESAWAVMDAVDIAQMPVTVPDVQRSVDQLAYMIYTSGSTGKPKGVMIPHKGIMNFLWWVKSFHGLSESDQVALVTSYAFDMTLATNWTPLFCGATIHVLHEEQTRDVECLLRFLSDRKITFLNVTPSQFSLIVSAREQLCNGPFPMVDSMRIMLGGEVINTHDLNAWLRHYPGHVFVNEYGPTEVSVATHAFEIPVEANGQISMTTVPIGRPIDNCSAYVLTPCGQPCMPGVAGELCLGGVGVALGYFQQPDKTRAAFVDDPFNPNGGRMYKTGDMARFWADGTLEFLGRQDHQINLRGYRIEAGEVEAALTSHPAVAQATVVDQLDSAGQRVLVAYIGGTSDVDDEALRNHLRDQLPSYMLPSHYVWLKVLPTTASGKLDRKALPPLSASSKARVPTGGAPHGDVEICLAEIWKEVLGVEVIGVEDNFWDMGGDSLRAMRLINRYREAGFSEVRLKDVLRFNTIRETARELSSIRASHANELFTVLRSDEEPVAQLILLPFACGNASSFVELASLLQGRLSVLALTPPEHWSTEGMRIEDMAKVLADEILQMPPDTPRYVVGYSFGGSLAVELVRQLEKSIRHAPAGIVLVATAPPLALHEVDFILTADDDELLKYSRDVYGFDPGVLKKQELDQYFFVLRAQTRAMARHQIPRQLQLRTPLLNLIGDAEEDAELAMAFRQWEAYFVQSEHAVLPGGHMLIKSHPEALAGQLTQFVQVCRAEIS